MKGLLLKEFYVMRKICRVYLILMVVFIAASVFSGDNLFMVTYPCMLCGVIPVSLLEYDDRCKWEAYSATLPYSRAQMVSAKYLIGLMVQLVMIVLAGIAQWFKLSRSNQLRADTYALLMLMLVNVTFLGSSISLPFMFKLGMTKGRIAYFLSFGSMGFFGVFAYHTIRRQISVQVSTLAVHAVITLAMIGVYALSWYLSIRFYKKREL